MAHSVSEPLSATVATEHILLSSDEQELMQTANVEIDTGSQRTCITNELEETICDMCYIYI